MTPKELAVILQKENLFHEGKRATREVRDKIWKDALAGRIICLHQQDLKAGEDYIVTWENETGYIAICLKGDSE